MKPYIASLDKGELHVHLNGLVKTTIISNLLASCNLPDGFDIPKDLIRTQPAKHFLEYLKPWQVLRLIPKNRAHLKIMIISAFENLREQNIKFAEIRSSVIYIAMLNEISIETALSWLIEEVESISEQFGIAAGVIMTICRGDYSTDHMRALLEAYSKLGNPKTVIGVDLAGYEEARSPEDLANLFLRAKKDFGLGVTIHAGETGNIKNIQDAVLNFGADRIGHGTAAGECVKTMELLKKSNVCVEVCPISNRLTGAVLSNHAHPVQNFVTHNVPFVVCSDNPSIHGLHLNDDYYELFKKTMNKDLLENMYGVQKQYSFLKGMV